MSNTDAEKVQLLCLDVDGVLTDGSILIDDHGVEAKRFHVRDGTGIRMWIGLGFHVAILTGRRGMAIQHRATELGIEYVFQGSNDKVNDFRSLLDRLGLNASQAAMIGDDLPDLPLLRMVGYPIAVADAVSEVRAVATLTTVRPGGRGAVREAIEYLLEAKGCLDRARKLYS